MNQGNFHFRRLPVASVVTCCSVSPPTGSFLPSAMVSYPPTSMSAMMSYPPTSTSAMVSYPPTSTSAMVSYPPNSTLAMPGTYPLTSNSAMGPYPSISTMALGPCPSISTSALGTYPSTSTSPMGTYPSFHQQLLGHGEDPLVQPTPRLLPVYRSSASSAASCSHYSREHSRKGSENSESDQVELRHCLQ